MAQIIVFLYSVLFAVSSPKPAFYLNLENNKTQDFRLFATIINCMFHRLVTLYPLLPTAALGPALRFPFPVDAVAFTVCTPSGEGGDLVIGHTVLRPNGRTEGEDWLTLRPPLGSAQAVACG
jgi:hypothetical protein